MTDHAVKRRRVLAILDDVDAPGVLLTSAAAVNWYLDGARTHVSLAAPPLVAVEVRRDGERILVTSNEAERLAEEELSFDIDLRVREWWSPLDASGAAADGLVPESAIAAPLRAARASLLPAERTRYAELCRDAAHAVTDALGSASPRETERAIAARVHAELVLRGADPLVVLVAGEHRLGHRHPLPTASPLGRRAMVVVCARRAGLIADVTRWIRFGSPRPEEADADARILEVEADIFAATRPGRSLAEVLREVATAYPANGFSADEWTRHHQGGIAGYDGRDPRATPDGGDRIPSSVHVAWNPSAPGTKVEDTVLIEDGGVTPLTVDDRWPTTVVRGVARPSVLQL